MALFTWHLSASPTLSEKPNVKNIKFGDGYGQRFTNGINSNPQKWSVSFKNRSESETNEILTFLRDRGGVEAFEWIPPGQANPIKVICQDWQTVVLNGRASSMSTTFEQVFDP